MSTAITAASQPDDATNPPGTQTWRLGSTLLFLCVLQLFLSPELSKPLSRALALVLIASWVVLRTGEFEFHKWLGPAGLLGAAGLVLTLLGESTYSWAVGGCLFVGGCAHAWTRGGLIAASFSLATTLVGVVWTIYLCSPWLADPVRSAWLSWSRAVGWVFGKTWEIGPTFQGAALVVPCVALIAARFLLLEWRPLRAVSAFGLFGLGSVVHLWLIELAHSNLPHYLLATLPWVGLGAWCTLVSVYWVGVPVRRPLVGSASPWGWRLAAAACAALALAIHGHVVTNKAQPRVLFYSANEGRILNWNRPQFGAYGGYSLGMFGLLREYLSADGFSVEFLRERITPQVLAGVDALVTINVNTEWTEDELLAVWEFVDGGGNLLVLGDHTGVGNSLGSQNDLLAPFGIAFQFDTVYPASPTAWEMSDVFFQQPVANLDRADALGVALGASLRLKKLGARPLIVARHGLADVGAADAPQRAFLGDCAYRPGEQLGDCVLAAWGRLGDGKALVFGDTSGFQNAVLPNTYDPYVRDLFGWLTGDTRFDLGVSGGCAASIAMALLAFAALVRLSRARTPSGLFLFALWMVVAASQVFIGRLVTRAPLALPHVLIDYSHLPRIESGGDGERSLDGFVNTVIRSGFVPRELREFNADQIQRAEVFLTVAPARRYSDEELAVLRAFMDSGGFVIVCASYPECSGVQGLVGLAGLEVLPRPIGSIPLHRTKHRVRNRVEYVDAWQVGVADSNLATQPWVYGDYEGAPLALLSRLGKGGMFLVGDSRFFGAQNLESFEEYSEPNILFLRSLLADFDDLREEAPR